MSDIIRGSRTANIILGRYNVVLSKDLKVCFYSLDGKNLATLLS